MTAALIRDLMHGLMSDFMDTEFPSTVYGFDFGSDILLDQSGTLFGFVWTGSLTLESEDDTHHVGALRYFAIPFQGSLRISGPARGFGVLRVGYHGLATVGGPVEPRGRLKYIDGCSDTLVIAPPLRGDPCFNLLHFPPNINQTKHTHPSIRVGLIHAGEGSCLTETGSEPLSPGKMFILYPDAVHAFSTEGTAGMNLTVFHPDSDFGPTHDEHPMLNRTIVDGVPAKSIDRIRTKELA